MKGTAGEPIVYFNTQIKPILWGQQSKATIGNLIVNSNSFRVDAYFYVQEKDVYITEANGKKTDDIHPLKKRLIKIFQKKSLPDSLKSQLQDWISYARLSYE